MVRSLALVTGVMMMFSPLKDMNEIRISNSLKNISIFNFLLLWLNYALWALYSSLMRSFDAICLMYFAGLIMSCCYCCFYMLHVHKSSLFKVVKLYFAALTAVMLTVIYAQSGIHSEHYTNHIVGLLACLATVCLAGFPLLMSPIIAETGYLMVSIPIYMSNITNSFLWFAYGFSVNDPYTANANLFAFVLSSIGVVIVRSATASRKASQEAIDK
jgi:hypothetical protein